MFDIYGAGAPSGIPAGAATVEAYLDTANSAIWVNTGSGFVPVSPAVVSKANALAQTANNANVVTFAAPVAGVYRVDLYEVSANAPTGATLPAITVAYTDAETSQSVTDTLASVSSVSAAGVVNQGSFLVNAKLGTNIVVATTSYAAGSGTALSYNVKARITRI